ncbi:Major sperm protein [Corchorus capsularis]|uniref:Major sperm protein n=1 Tax=Corchorus capsularis TaxID=210143 RepID=A0A1R3GIW3_COCAP|nr:Major sperm protein [Corchorus capsularis]
MSTQLLEIQPKELKFIFILKKQCSCKVTLTNTTNQYVAFKVKTTSPKKYCVRPNVGVIMPKSICDFTVTMQAQREAPPDMICKDKFLIQSTVVHAGTTDEDISSATFVKDNGRYVEENKLKVVLVSPPPSPVLSPINGTMNQGIDYDSSIPKETTLTKVGIIAPLLTVTKVEESKTIDVEDLKPTNDVDWKSMKDMSYAEKPKKDAELKPRNDVVNPKDLKATIDADLKPKNNFVNGELKPVKEVESKPMEDTLDTEELKLVKEKELNTLKNEEVKAFKAVEDLKLVKDVEQMKSKLNDLESKLSEAEATISKLTEERRLSTQERKILQEELFNFSSFSLLRIVQCLFFNMWLQSSVFTLYGTIEDKDKSKKGSSGVPSLICLYGSTRQCLSWIPFAPLNMTE